MKLHHFDLALLYSLINARLGVRLLGRNTRSSLHFSNDPSLIVSSVATRLPWTNTGVNN